MAALLKAIHKLTAISIKIPFTAFTKSRKSISKIYKTMSSQINPEQKEKY
jgi:hypothetical protein